MHVIHSHSCSCSVTVSQFHLKPQFHKINRPCSLSLSPSIPPCSQPENIMVMKLDTSADPVLKLLHFSRAQDISTGEATVLQKSQQESIEFEGTYVPLMYVYTHTHTHVHTYTQAHEHAHAHTCTYTRTHARTQVHTHSCTHIHSHK